MRGIFYLVLSSILILTGCNSAEVEVGMMKSQDPELENAKKAIESIILPYKTKQGIIGNSTLSLKESKVIDLQVEEGARTKETIKLFIFDYIQDGKKGFAIASGDERISSAYAIVDNGNLSDTTFNYGLKLLLSGIPGIMKSDLKQLREAKDTKKEFTNISSPKVSPYYSSVLLKTQWGQRDPYNRTCKVKGETCIPPSGCTATALAQVIAYFNKPSSRFQGLFDYTAMTSNPSANNLSTSYQNMVAKFVHYCGVKADMEYGCASSGAWPQNFADFGLLGYTCSGSYGFSVDKHYENILEGRPQIMVGYREDFTGGHTWVADGFQYFVYNPPIFRYVIHCNFGWNGTDDGWFRLSDEDILDYSNLYYTLYFDGFTSSAELDNKTYTGPNE